MSDPASSIVSPQRPAQHDGDDARRLSGSDLADALRECRANTWACVQDLTDAQWLPPYQTGINPIAWELGHLAWFAEYWILRGPHLRDAGGLATSSTPPRFAGPDSTFDSARLAHASRWSAALPTRSQLHDLMHTQLEACIHAIAAASNLEAPNRPRQSQADYYHRLSLFHEDMHAEALRWLRFNLAYSAPEGLLAPRIHPPGSIDVPGGLATLGLEHRLASQSEAFWFDNETGTRQVTLAPFTIDVAPITAGIFSEFVDSGGYEKPEFWPAKAGLWRASSSMQHPATWRRTATGSWQQRWFNQYLPLDPDAAVIHINAFEAEAYCLWAKRRLPTAAEWEYAAQLEPGFYWGHSVWEWTADAFEPYDGFTPGPYREYSQPWFGNHRELRGGAYATQDRMHNCRYRNFFLPHRSDIFAGFRTVTM